MTDLFPARSSGPKLRSSWSTLRRGSWRVDYLEPTPGSVGVTARPEGVTVVIGDGHGGQLCCTTVDLDLRGEASVRTSVSPPCVLMTPSEVRMVPDGPQRSGTARLEVGDRLLMMSAEALGALPEALSLDPPTGSGVTRR